MLSPIPSIAVSFEIGAAKIFSMLPKAESNLCASGLVFLRGSALNNNNSSHSCSSSAFLSIFAISLLLCPSCSFDILFDINPLPVNINVNILSYSTRGVKSFQHYFRKKPKKISLFYQIFLLFFFIFSHGGRFSLLRLTFCGRFAILYLWQNYIMQSVRGHPRISLPSY